MNISLLISPLLAVSAVATCLTGCSFLKPSGVQTQSFVLTPLPVSKTSPPFTNISVGVGFVKLPAYLFKNPIAMRRGTNQIVYLDGSVWSEQLDSGLQRVIAANLATLLPTERIRLSAWRPEEVNVEVFVAVEQFDVDDTGGGVLSAWWRVAAPDGDGASKKAAWFRGARRGPAPNVDPNGATATLSALVADLSREVAEAIRPARP